MADICTICKTSSKRYRYKLTCANCRQKIHLKCTRFTKLEFNDLAQNDWMCQTCVGEILPFNQIEDDNDFRAALSELWYDATRN